MKKATMAFLLVCCLGLTLDRGLGQDASEPLSKQELLQLLDRARHREITQAEIAAIVERRGLKFIVDDRMLDEFRRAGARSFLLGAIKRASRATARKRLSSSEAPSSTIPPQAVSQETHVPASRQDSLIERARYHALQYVRELPNFVVTQIVTRYVRTPGMTDWQRQDRLEIELTYRTDSGESFKLLRINGAPTTLSYEELGGSTSTGELGSLLAGVFAPQSHATFKEVGHETFRGRPTVVYDFRVLTRYSKSHITDKNSGQTIVSGFQGSVWIDVETQRVLRLELSHDDIPPGFPITLAENAVEYDWVTIAGERYLLPVRAEVLLGRDRERYYTRNVIEFRRYRKFEAELQVIPENSPP